MDNPPDQWLEQNLKSGAEARLRSVAAHHRERGETAEGLRRRPAPNWWRSTSNPIDALWRDRPAPPAGAVTLRDIKLAGESAADKLKRIQAELDKLRADVLVVSDPQNVAWAFNIRGSDVAHTPLALAFAIVPREGRPALYVDAAKLDNETRHALEEIAEVRAPDDLARDLAQFKGKTVRLDQASAADALTRLVAEQRRQAGARRRPDRADEGGEEPRRDRRLARRASSATAWRWRAFSPGSKAKRRSGKLTEIDAVEALESFRRDTGLLKDISFPTIAGAGPNGAIVHYRVTRATNRTLGNDELFLIDSGAQYEDGTTDITRTVAIGTPTEEMRDRFTRVLKGHIAIATAVFPENTSGAQLDPLARTALWQAGLDFDHGTGHGVGSYLSVHEGPARISKLGTVALKRGMILSNEPGYYKTGAYGIRIENLLLVIAAPEPAGRREAAQCVRDADAGADRPAADRHPHADRQGAQLDRRLSRPRAGGDRPAARCADAGLARSRDQAAGKFLMDARTSASPTPAKISPRRLLPLLMAMTAIGPATLNILVPALPGLVTRLASDAGTVQLTLSLYLLSLASRPTAARAVVRPLRPPAGGARRAGAQRRRLARGHCRLLDRRPDRARASCRRSAPRPAS